LICALVGAAAPPPSAANAAAPTVAVFAFENPAGAPAPVIASLNDSLYRAASGSDRYQVVGGRALPLATAPHADALSAALTSAGKLGTKQMLVGSVLRYADGKAVYRLSSYGVSPLQPLGSRVFAQVLTGSDTESMAAAFARDIAALHGSRSASGTIYSVDGAVTADVGTVEGFHLGQRFHVLRNGQRVAEAQTSEIEDISGKLTITSAAAGYRPAVGDRLESDEALAPASSQIKGESNTFNPLMLLLAVGAVIIALGHNGKPAAPSGARPSASPSAAPFAITQPTVTGTALQQPITFVFPFTAPIDLTAGNPATNTALAYYTIPRLGPQQFPLSQLGTPTFTNNNATLSITSSGVVQPGDKVTFTFLSTIRDVNGRPLQPASFSSQFAALRQPI
jgi:hypothetical protein